MNLFKNKQAMGLPMVLGIVVFVIGISVSLLSYIVFQSTLVENDIRKTEEYQNAVTNLNAAVHIMARENNPDQTFIDNLENYFLDEIIISTHPNNINVYVITSMLNNVDSLTSYMTGSTTTSDIYDSLFSKTGQEPDFELSPFISATSLLTKYIPDFISKTFPNIPRKTDLETFKDVMKYVEDLAKEGSTFQFIDEKDIKNYNNITTTGSWFVDGDLSIKNNSSLVVPDGQVLFINGDLTMGNGSSIYGNVVVYESLKINGTKHSEQTIVGTLYVREDIEFKKDDDRSLTLGTTERPTFIFSEGDIDFEDNVVSGVGYFLSDEFEAENRSNNIIGGVYADDIDISRNTVFPNPNFNITKLYDFFIPSQMSTESTDPGDTNNTFIYTPPKLN